MVQCKKLMYLLPLLAIFTIAATSTTQAKAWDGDWGGSPVSNQPVCGAFCAGEQDAAYDHENGYQYNPVGQCLPCHSQYYWTNFQEGYDHKWNILQSQQQDSSQGSYMETITM